MLAASRFHSQPATVGKSTAAMPTVGSPRHHVRQAKPRPTPNLQFSLSKNQPNAGARCQWYGWFSTYCNTFLVEVPESILKNSVTNISITSGV